MSFNEMKTLDNLFRPNFNFENQFFIFPGGTVWDRHMAVAIIIDKILSYSVLTSHWYDVVYIREHSDAYAVRLISNR